MPPALLAEQQRAKSEIEASLTIAAARPRDEVEAVGRILNSCQRVGLAEKATYSYSRGGTDITGPTIDLMEAVAQHWGNLEFGFRELARFPGTATQAGESIVEAFSWDLQSNVRRRTQFTVSHAIGTKKGTKILTDPRDIYEWIANQAQRRVRTCLENIIPRDVVEDAVEECDKTLHTKVDMSPATMQKLLQAFAGFGVTKAQIEARIQRSIDSIAPAQVVALRKIYASLRDKMSDPGDWFEAAPAADAGTSAMDKAKAAVKAAKRGAQQTTPPEPDATETHDVGDVTDASGQTTDDVVNASDQRRREEDAIRGKRGERSNDKDGLFDKGSPRPDG